MGWSYFLSSVFLFCHFQILTVDLICRYRILNQIVLERTTASRSSKALAWLTKSHLRPQSLGLLTKFKTHCKIMSFRHLRKPLWISNWTQANTVCLNPISNHTLKAPKTAPRFQTDPTWPQTRTRCWLIRKEWVILLTKMRIPAQRSPLLRIL